METFNKALEKVLLLNEEFPTGFINYELVGNNGNSVLECDIRLMVSTDNGSTFENERLMKIALQDLKKLKDKYDGVSFKFIVRLGKLRFIEGVFKIEI